MIISQVTFPPIFIQFGIMAWWAYVGDIGVRNAAGHQCKRPVGVKIDVT